MKKQQKIKGRGRGRPPLMDGTKARTMRLSEERWTVLKKLGRKWLEKKLDLEIRRRNV